MIQGVKKYLTETIKIYTVTEAEDAYGGIYLTRTLKTTIKGRVRQLNQTERYISDKNSEEVNARLYIKPIKSQTEDLTSSDFARFDVMGFDTHGFGGTITIYITDEVEHKSKIYRMERFNDVMNFGELLQVDLRLVQ